MKTRMLFPLARAARLTALGALLLVALAAPALAQTLDFDRERCRLILREMRDDIKSNYYDPNFHGMDLEARYKAADEKLKKAESRGQMFGIIAQMLIEFDDSHTFFVPPERAARVDYGWRAQMVGDRSFVVAVKPGSDAESKGLKVGDEILEVDGVGLTRDNLWKFYYLYNALRPRPGVRLVAQSPGAEPRQLDVLAKVRQRKKVTDLTDSIDFWEFIREAESRVSEHRAVEVGQELLIWRMPAFDLPENRVDEMMGKAKGRKALILDLRGNGGGYEDTMLRLIGNLFDRDVKIGELKRRKEAKTLVAKTRGGEAYGGQLVVLVDSESGSAAELLARVVQLEKRGTVVGDRTAGAVMRSRFHRRDMGADVKIFYGASITDADVLMTDGKSLEKVGVTPDVPVLPAGADLAARRDLVLAHAASLVGVKLEAGKAGSLFPVELKK